MITVITNQPFTYCILLPDATLRMERSNASMPDCTFLKKIKALNLEDTAVVMIVWIFCM